MAGEFEGRMDPCVCMAESLCCPPETTVMLFIGCFVTEKTKISKKKKKPRGSNLLPTKWKINYIPTKSPKEILTYSGR